jgi:hypothetical protein
VTVTSPCRSATSLSFRKERDVSATPKQGEVKDKALWLRLPKSSISECSKSNRNNTAHDYGVNFAEEVILILPSFITDAKEIVQAIKQQNDATTQ